MESRVLQRGEDHQREGCEKTQNGFSGCRKIEMRQQQLQGERIYALLSNANRR